MALVWAFAEKYCTDFRLYVVFNLRSQCNTRHAKKRQEFSCRVSLRGSMQGFSEPPVKKRMETRKIISVHSNFRNALAV